MHLSLFSSRRRRVEGRGLAHPAAARGRTVIGTDTRRTALRSRRRRHRPPATPRRAACAAPGSPALDFARPAPPALSLDLDRHLLPSGSLDRHHPRSNAEPPAPGQDRTRLCSSNSLAIRTEDPSASSTSLAIRRRPGDPSPATCAAPRSPAPRVRPSSGTNPRLTLPRGWRRQLQGWHLREPRPHRQG